MKYRYLTQQGMIEAETAIEFRALMEDRFSEKAIGEIIMRIEKDGCMYADKECVFQWMGQKPQGTEKLE